jgi:serine/threonine protein kinase
MTSPMKVPETPKNQKLGNYLLGKFLGKGAFGKVVQAKHIVTGNKVAVKYLTKGHIMDIEQVGRKEDGMVCRCADSPRRDLSNHR